MSSVINEFSFVSASSSTSQLCWLGRSAEPLRELLALFDEDSGTLLGVVCADLPSTTSGVESSTNLEGDLLFNVTEEILNEYIFFKMSTRTPIPGPTQKTNS